MDSSDALHQHKLLSFRYSKIADSSKNYIITQYGISCFEMTGEASHLQAVRSVAVVVWGL